MKIIKNSLKPVKASFKKHLSKDKPNGLTICHFDLQVGSGMSSLKLRGVRFCWKTPEEKDIVLGYRFRTKREFALRATLPKYQEKKLLKELEKIVPNEWKDQALENLTQNIELNKFLLENLEDITVLNCLSDPEVKAKRLKNVIYFEACLLENEMEEAEERERQNGVLNFRELIFKAE